MRTNSQQELKRRKHLVQTLQNFNLSFSYFSLISRPNPTPTTSLNILLIHGVLNSVWLDQFRPQGRHSLLLNLYSHSCLMPGPNVISSVMPP